MSHRWFSKEQRCHFHVNISTISKWEKGMKDINMRSNNTDYKRNG